MATAVITFTDAEDGDVNIHCDFGAAGGDDSSQAHRTAMHALMVLAQEGGVADLVITGGNNN